MWAQGNKRGCFWHLPFYVNSLSLSFLENQRNQIQLPQSRIVLASFLHLPLSMFLSLQPFYVLYLISSGLTKISLSGDPNTLLVRYLNGYYQSGSQSSLHWTFSFSFCSFQYNGVCFDKLKLSVSDDIVSQKGSNGDRKLHFFEGDYNFNRTLCAKPHLWAKIQSNGYYSQNTPIFQYHSKTRLVLNGFTYVGSTYLYYTGVGIPDKKYGFQTPF